MKELEVRTWALLLLSIFIFVASAIKIHKLEKRIEWLEAQQDNVIETLITE